MTSSKKLLHASCLLAGCFILFTACRQKQIKEGAPEEKNFSYRVHSKAVGDSFTIFINLPNHYSDTSAKKYPVVFLLDANLYFDIVAATLNRYSEVGLAPEVVLVGIGYKDFQQMDSLRNRDDTYPAGLPEYEMTASGGGEHFLHFITDELVPDIDSRYKTDTVHRVLMGHSLGGYFTTYALVQTLAGKSKAFKHFIAASPSLDYNHYYIFDRLKKVNRGTGTDLTAYFTFGGLEDQEDGEDLEPGVLKSDEALSSLSIFMRRSFVRFKTDVFSGLVHMDTQMPTFTKGLQELMKDEH